MLKFYYFAIVIHFVLTPCFPLSDMGFGVFGGNVQVTYFFRYFFQ
jgi:hypothetical protein